MATKAAHIIKKQRYDINVQSQQQGRLLQRQLQSINLHQVLPALSNKLDEMFLTDEVVIIDKVVVDIGNVENISQPELWAEKIIAGLGEQVKRLPHSPIEEGLNGLKKIDRAEHAIKVFIGFLQTGMLPSETFFNSLQEVKEELFKLNESDKSRLQNELLALLPVTAVIQRLAAVRGKELFFFLALYFPDVSEEAWHELMEKLSAVMTEASRKSKKGITSSVSTVKSTIVSFIVSEVLNTAKQDKKPQANDLYNLVKEKLLLAGEIKNKEKEQGDKAGEADVKLLPEEGTFISSAGICLLAPYLPAFFKTLELCDRASFYSAGKQQHAVYLVNYLATGELEPSEEKLVFSKLLCGWPLQMPCLDTDGISAFEVKESVELLESVINHWAALKKTTPDGLREGFLKRRGKLAESDEHFVLQMEQQSIDVLLDQVPWTFRLIKLPWMKKSVMVEWF